MYQQLLFELLRIALGSRNHLSRVPSAQEWNAIYDEAERQAIASVLTDGLDKLPKEQRPMQAILFQWIGLTNINEATYTLHVERAKDLTGRFLNSGFNTCILKGLSAAARYPHPNHRQCGDIDIWVSGNRVEVMEWLQKQYEIGTVIWHHVDPKIYDDVSVEVHFHPIWLYNPKHNSIIQKWFSEQRKLLFGKPLNKQGFGETTAGFDTVYQLVHCFHHLLEEGLGLRHVIDYYYVLKNLKDDERKDALVMIQRIGVFKFATAMMWVLREICGMSSEELICEPDDSEGRFLMKEIMSGGNFGKARQDGKQRNTYGRWRMMLKHYPSEVFWMIPWKTWHRTWMFIHNK